jgi:hypothetical protein
VRKMLWLQALRVHKWRQVLKAQWPQALPTRLPMALRWHLLCPQAQAAQHLCSQRSLARLLGQQLQLPHHPPTCANHTLTTTNSGQSCQRWAEANTHIRPAAAHSKVTRTWPARAGTALACRRCWQKPSHTFWRTGLHSQLRLLTAVQRRRAPRSARSPLRRGQRQLLAKQTLPCRSNAAMQQVAIVLHRCSPGAELWQMCMTQVLSKNLTEERKAHLCALAEVTPQLSSKTQQRVMTQHEKMQVLQTTKVQQRAMRAQDVL